MSVAYINKPQRSTICDYCKKEISEDDMSHWAHIVRGYISRPTEKAKFLRFLWIKDKRYVESKPGNKVIYDFHAACFDKLVRKYQKSHSKEEK